MNLEKILEKHEMWLRGEEGGERANLSGYDLINANLSSADLINANLRDVDLSSANLRNIILRSANLRDANLMGADLRGANLINANLRNSDLRNADLRFANLSDADLRDANLRGADLRNIKTNMYTMGYSLACPEEGGFIGYKKADKYLVKLLIPEDAKRLSATSRKCRCNKAKVLGIYDYERNLLEVKEVVSDRDKNFIYQVGKTVEVKDFDEDRWHECSTGIHFFINFEEAVRY